MLFIDVAAIINSFTFEEKLTDSDGYPIGGIRRLLYNLLTIWKDRKDIGETIAVFGSCIPKWRRELVPKYRRARSTTHKKYRAYVHAQVKLLWELLPEIGITCMLIKGFEALDGIFKWQIDNRLEYDFNTELFTYSTDRNALSLIRQNRFLFAKFHDKTKKEFYEPFIVERTFRFVGDQNALYIALRGNKKLGIPRIKNIGNKTARNILIETNARIPDNLSAYFRPEDMEQLRKSWQVLSLAYAYTHHCRQMPGEKTMLRFRRAKFPKKKQFEEILNDELNIDDFIMHYDQFIKFAKEKEWRK